MLHFSGTYRSIMDLLCAEIEANAWQISSIINPFITLILYKKKTRIQYVQNIYICIEYLYMKFVIFKRFLFRYLERAFLFANEFPDPEKMRIHTSKQ